MGHHFHVHHSLLNGRVKQQCFHRFCVSHDDGAAPAWLLFDPSLTWCHLKRTHNSAKFETLKLFFFLFLNLFFSLAYERIFIKMRSLENRCYRTRKYTLWRHTHASFSLEILQARSVKGLTCRYTSLTFIYIPSTCLHTSACRTSCETAMHFWRCSSWWRFLWFVFFSHQKHSAWSWQSNNEQAKILVAPAVLLFLNRICSVGICFGKYLKRKKKGKKQEAKTGLW